MPLLAETQAPRFTSTAAPVPENARNPLAVFPVAAQPLAVTLARSSARSPNWPRLMTTPSKVAWAEAEAPGLTSTPPPAQLRMVVLVMKSWATPAAGSKSTP